MSGFSASLSGIRSSFLRQSVTGNNVANLSTSGFKSSRALQASSGDGLGTSVEALRTDTSQGSLTPTGRSTDAAIDGEGYFVVEKDGETSLTRAGSFGLDADGRLVNQVTGGLVQGLENGETEPIEVDSSERILAPEATDSLSLTGNLSPEQDVGESVPVSLDLNNSRGGTQSVPLRFEKIATNQYELTAEDPRTGDRALEADLSFDSDGQVASFEVKDSPNAGGSFQGLYLTGRDGAKDIQVSASDLEVSNLTQQGGETTVQAAATSGREAGELTSVSLGNDGRLLGTYDNGRRRELGQVAVATVPNPAGLNNVGDSLLRPSANSGSPQAGVPGNGGRGSLRTGVLESSNVDLAGSLTDSLTNRSSLDANVSVLGVQREMTGSLLDLTG